MIYDATVWSGKITPVSLALIPDLQNPEIQLLLKATKFWGRMLGSNRYGNRTLTFNFSFFTNSLPPVYKSAQFLPVLKASLSPTLGSCKALRPSVATIFKKGVDPHCFHALIFHALNTYQSGVYKLPSKMAGLQR